MRMVTFVSAIYELVVVINNSYLSGSRTYVQSYVKVLG